MAALNNTKDTEAKLTQAIDEVKAEVATKMGTDEAMQILDQKSDLTFVSTQLEEYAKIAQTQQLVDTIQQIQNDLEANIAISEQLSKKSSQIVEDLSTKACAADVSTLIDSKANIDDINDIIRNINIDIGSKVNYMVFTDFTTEQAVFNEAISAENCIGRWIWKSGQVGVSGLVPWEAQVVNTCPENYVWQKDVTYIMMVTPGLYEISLGMFVRQAPSVSVQVNGESVLLLKGNKSTKPRALGDIAGHTLSDFIALPARARLSITYAGDPGAEGFLHLRKL